MRRRAAEAWAIVGIAMLVANAAWSAPLPGGEESRTPAVAKSLSGRALASQSSALIALDPLPLARAKTLDPLPQDDGAQQIGIARAVPAHSSPAAMSALRWMPATDGSLAAAFTVSSPAAAALRVAIAVPGAPRGTRLGFARGEGEPFFEIADSAAVTWGPVIAGDSQLIQVMLPAGADPRQVRVVVDGVSHLVSDPSVAAPAIPGPKSAASCQQDVACAPASEALSRAVRSVAKIVYTVNGNTYSCTGTLVNDAQAATQIPYVLTAKHCIDSPAAAATVNSFWFLEAASCGGKAGAQAVQLTKGARLLHAGTLSDMALIRLNEPAPAGAWFSAIDASPPSAGDTGVAVHHPSGGLKKVSSGRIVGAAEGTAGRLVSMAWLAGSTEPGSSGSALFTERGGQYVVRGTLRGGSASCSNSGLVEDPANRDYYERLDADAAAIQSHLLAAAAPLEDYTDLWIVPGQPGTGISVTQHASNATFIVWFHYDPLGQPTWITVPGGTWTASDTFTGTLYRARRPGGAVAVEPAGMATFTFSARDRANVSYTLDGRTEQLALERQLF